MPDMAHALWPIGDGPESLGSDPGPETLCLLRRDQEAIPIPETVCCCQHGAIIDWTDVVGYTDTMILAAIAAGFAGRRAVRLPLPINDLMDWEIDRLVRRAISVLAPYKRVVTSRLHGALLALLMGKRVDLLDSLTGKAGAYYVTWLDGIDGCRLHRHRDTIN
jgi:pyruvyl transferase EpsO